MLTGLLSFPLGRAPGLGRTVASPTLLTPFCNNKSFIYFFAFELQLRFLFPFLFLDNKPFSFAFRTDIQVCFVSLLFCDPHTISMKPFITEITCHHETSIIGSVTYAIGCCSKESVSISTGFEFFLASPSSSMPKT